MLTLFASLTFATVIAIFALEGYSIDNEIHNYLQWMEDDVYISSYDERYDNLEDGHAGYAPYAACYYSVTIDINVDDQGNIIVDPYTPQSVILKLFA